MTRSLALMRLALPGTSLRPLAARAQEPRRIGKVSTTFRVLGRNDRVVVDRCDDAKVPGVLRYVSRAETGGVKVPDASCLSPLSLCRPSRTVVARRRTSLLYPWVTFASPARDGTRTHDQRLIAIQGKLEAGGGGVKLRSPG
jgi:hypothetical protein